MKNDIICVFRLYASTIKNKPDTTLVVDEPIALIDMLMKLVLDVFIGNVVVDVIDAIEDVSLWLLLLMMILSFSKSLTGSE